MKDAFTTALSEVVQHQVELTSVIESILANPGVLKGSCADVDALRSMLGHFNVQANDLANRLVTRYDENPERPTSPHTGVSST